MSKWAPRLCVLSVALWFGASCAPLQMAPSPELAAPPALQTPPAGAAVGSQAVEAPPVPVKAEPVAQASHPGPQSPSAAADAGQQGAPAAERPASIRLGAPAPALTETLNQTLNMLTKERNENERLRQSVGSLEQAVAEKDRTIADLTTQLHANDARIQQLEGSLEQWKVDVLGFRDEMRKAEEAEIEVLQKILLLLDSFRKEKVTE